ncbi:hypothetical protein CCZ01_09055 [Helicobacter monodelphidis]|uniref:TrbI/VirB10 family protein n=1 Tax=Helicobacter sp. 15-1451 TaxID=2004995 RepID=UPI000DCE2FDA|nr:TrbI/VirB10 family protein [Helicobacter sp. 15-1451]RAX56587.1 hypothetical protein CCZ01_09055 [Helicobacter sp. 15-1451]
MKEQDILKSPTSLNLKQTFDNPIKRLSKVPLIVIALILFIFVVGIVYAISSRNAQNQIDKSSQMKITTEQQQTATTTTANTNDFIDELMIPSSIPPKEASEESTIPPSTDTATPQPQNIPPAPIPEDPQARLVSEQQNRIDTLKMELKLKAMGAQTQLQLKQPLANTNTGALTNSIAEHGGGRTDFNPLELAKMGRGEVEDNDDRIAKFMNKKSESGGYLERMKIPQFSPYELKTGWIIPAMLITSINSDLPGSILAQVTENIYDSATGQYLLIPQGSKLIGEYSSNIIFGQSRLMVAWTRIVFPDGSTLNLEKMAGHDSGGVVGFEDQVNNHYFKIFSNAILMSAITAGVTVAADKGENPYKETINDKVIAAAVAQLGQVGIELIRKNMNIAPTLEIRSGYRFNVFVTKDIILEPINNY